MATQDTCCTIVPYFDVPDSYMDTFKSVCPKLVEAALSESGCLFYGFGFCGTFAHCREGDKSADAVLVHLTNVAEALGELLKHAKLVRLGIHGPEAELAKRCAPFTQQSFTFEYGLRR